MILRCLHPEDGEPGPFGKHLKSNLQLSQTLKGGIPITLASAVSFYIPFYAVARFVGPELSVVIGSLVSLACIILIGRKLKQDIPEEYQLNKPAGTAVKNTLPQKTAEASGKKMGVLTAWLPYILILIFLLGASNFHGAICPEC